MAFRLRVLYYEYDCNLIYIFDSLQLAKALQDYNIVYGSIHRCDIVGGYVASYNIIIIVFVASFP